VPADVAELERSLGIVREDVPTDRAEIERRLGEVAEDDRTTLEPVLVLRDSDEALAVVGELISGGLAGDARWAAVLVYASAGEDPEVLRPLVADADPSVAVRAAAGLAYRGDLTGIGGLVAALGSQDHLSGSNPPVAIWRYATQQLVRLTAISDLGPPFDASPDQVLAAAARWRVWFEQNQAKLSFAGGLWRTQEVPR
jgi:hypothetical protein